MDNEELDFRARIDNPDKVEKREKSDPFSQNVEIVKSYDGMSHNFKRRMARNLNKAYTGVENTRSKQLFPEQDMVTAYGLFDVVIPPYNLDELAFFFDNSFANHAAIAAKVSNIVGLGYGFENTESTTARLEEAGSEDQLMRAQRKIQRLKAQLGEWLESLNRPTYQGHLLGFPV